MTAQTRANLKARFQTGDRPSGADFEDLIDSSVNLQDVSAQVYVGSIQAPGIVVSTVSADAVYTSNFFVSAFSVATVSATNANIATVSATTVIAETVRASAVRHKNPYVSLYQAAGNTVTLPANTNYFVLSAITSSEAELGFTHTQTGRVTYTGSVTAAMQVTYWWNGYTNSAAVEFTTGIFKNSAYVPGSEAVFNVFNTERRGYGRTFITKMKTNDFLELNIKKASTLTYELVSTELNIVVSPVSFEF